MDNYLHDGIFLKQLDLQRNKEIFARITALTMEELPVEWVEGKIQNSGSVSVDGNSAIRRTCSLSLLAQDVNINQYNWGLNHKFKLEVGLTNTIDPKYPDICWFKQGIYVITGFSCNISNNNYSISISGKDKGCMLNGEVGGQLPASIDFGKIEDYKEFYEEVTVTEDIYETNKYYRKTSLPENYDSVIEWFLNSIWCADANNHINELSNADWLYWDPVTLLPKKYWDLLKPYTYQQISQMVSIVTDQRYYQSQDENRNTIMEQEWDNRIRPALDILYPFVFHVVSSINIPLGERANNKLVVALYRLKVKAIYTLSSEPFNENTTYYMKSSEIYTDKVPIKTIIREAVHTYAREPYANIIINDLDDYGMELMEYRGNESIYLTHLLGAEVYGQMVRGSQECRIVPDNITNTTVTYNKSEFDNLSSATFGTLGDYDNFTTELETHLGKKVIVNVAPAENTTKTYKVFTVSKIDYGMTPGYRITPLVYPGELISSIGETLSSILDKIKNMLTAFEYFYDLDGRFVFQKKQLFTMTSWNNIVDDKAGQRYVTPAMLSTPYYYTFEDSMIVTAFNNQPNLNNLRNDYSVWGKRKTVTGAEVPIHMRIALDKKPKVYARLVVDDIKEVAKLQKLYPTIFTSVDLNNYIQEEEYYVTTNEDKEILISKGIQSDKIYVYDWRELVYRMALDYYKYGQMEDFDVRLANTNRDIWDFCNDDPAAANPYLYFKTGYEQYYIDLQGFWRQLYDPQPLIRTDADGNKSCDYYIYNNNIQPESFYTTDQSKQYWNTNIYNQPELLNFWFDLYDGGEMNQYSISAVGQRPKVVNDNNVKSIYYRDTPTIIFTTMEKYVANLNVINSGYRYIFITQAMEDQLFTISTQGKSAKDAIDDLLYTNAYCVESVSMTTFPIYYLEPNVYVYIKDKQSGINGQYSITKFTVPLTYNGTMSITATKAVNRII